MLYRHHIQPDLQHAKLAKEGSGAGDGIVKEQESEEQEIGVGRDDQEAGMGRMTELDLAPAKEFNG